MEEYEVIEIQGRNGIILLHVPKREATEDEINELYDAVATIASKLDSKRAATK